MTRIDLIRRRLRCSDCDKRLDLRYPQYHKLVRFLSEEVFLRAPNFYNKRTHGRSIKWYKYYLSNVITDEELENPELFKQRVERKIYNQFDFHRLVKVKIVKGWRRDDLFNAIIVTFKYHGEFE